MLSNLNTYNNKIADNRIVVNATIDTNGNVKVEESEIVYATKNTDLYTKKAPKYIDTTASNLSENNNNNNRQAPVNNSNQSQLIQTPVIDNNNDNTVDTVNANPKDANDQTEFNKNLNKINFSNQTDINNSIDLYDEFIKPINNLNNDGMLPEPHAKFKIVIDTKLKFIIKIFSKISDSLSYRLDRFTKFENLINSYSDSGYNNKYITTNDDESNQHYEKDEYKNFLNKLITHDKKYFNDNTGLHKFSAFSTLKKAIQTDDQLLSKIKAFNTEYKKRLDGYLDLFKKKNEQYKYIINNDYYLIKLENLLKLINIEIHKGNTNTNTKELFNEYYKCLMVDNSLIGKTFFWEYYFVIDTIKSRPYLSFIQTSKSKSGGKNKNRKSKHMRKSGAKKSRRKH